MSDAADAAEPESAAARCLNCNAVLTGPFCAACGQRDDRHVHSIGHFLAEAFEGLTHADSRLWKTLWPLLVRPGFLTREFFAGRRQRYLPPFRLYIVVSLLFFLVLALLPDLQIVQIDMTPVQAQESVGAGEPALPGVQCNDLSYPGPGALWLRQPLMFGGRTRLAETYILGRASLLNLKSAMFFLLPLIAAFMLLFNWRPRR